MPTAAPFLVLQAGECSFCRRNRAGVHTVLGMAMRDASICDECVALAWELIAAEVDVDPPCDLHGRVCFDDVGFDERFFREHLDATSPRLANERASRRAAAAGQSSVWTARVARARASMPALRCTFCGLHRGDVLTLIPGSGTFICDECVESATSVIVDALRA